MARPVPTRIYHFTHVQNLPGIVENGLLSDATCHDAGATQVHIGDSGIKERRRRRRVPIEPGGFVGDYVPFYFAWRSPMMYTLQENNYEYRGGFDDVVYVVSSLERLGDLGVPYLVSDRNAALSVARFLGPDGDLDEHVDWDLMHSGSWGKTEQDRDRPDRRMAECLAHLRVPWEVVERVATRSVGTARLVMNLLADHGARVPVDVRPRWYF